MNTWWPNRVLPAVLAVVFARLIFVAFAQGPTSVLVVFGAVLAGLPTLYFMAAHVVGFVYGLQGREPTEKTRWFEDGWRVGQSRNWRSES